MFLFELLWPITCLRTDDKDGILTITISISYKAMVIERIVASKQQRKTKQAFVRLLNSGLELISFEILLSSLGSSVSQF